MSEAKLDITSTAVEKGIDLVKGFVEKLVGASIEEVGLMWADNVKLRRFKNQIKILTKAQKIVAESGINVKQISLKTLVPLLEYSSLEDDETLQDKWTNLIVNFIDSNQKYESTIFPFILNQLSSKEVFILDDMYKNRLVNNYGNAKIHGIYKHNLIRLGVIEVVIDSGEMKTFTTMYTPPSNRVIITELGIEFVKCCSPREK